MTSYPLELYDAPNETWRIFTYTTAPAAALWPLGARRASSAERRWPRRSFDHTSVHVWSISICQEYF
jgi:hypothetical protein